ncbi:hypothetical protein LCGC14_3147310, partial [marine sediment metagenome]
MSFKNIYLDNNATTMTAPEVLEAMLPFLGEKYGNPSSMHSFGGVIQKDLEQAREKVAELLNCHPTEVVYTSCGSESDNFALRGLVDAYPEKRHIITTKDDGSLRCVACYMCETACPADCIKIIAEEDPEATVEWEKRPLLFEIDLL